MIVLSRGGNFMRRIIRTAALLGFSILAASSVVHAQQGGKIPRIGVIGSLLSSSAMRTPFQPLLDGLRDLGYDEGRNISFEFRSAEGHVERLPDVAAELVALKVDVLVSGVCGTLLNALRHATSTIPIVVAACNDDMIETGIIANLAHPGGNVTGLNKMTPEMTAKRLDLLKEMVPAAGYMSVLWDPGYSAFAADWQLLRERARMKGVRLQPVEAHDPADLDKAFTLMARERVDAVLTFSDLMTYNFPTRVAALAAENRLPLISPYQEITSAGGLMSYGPSIPDMFRRAAGYVDKILKGANPADLPVEQPTKFEMAINLKAAKALGLTVPVTLIARADEIIE
jgi:putative ABC transport system substrate-binding protein